VSAKDSVYSHSSSSTSSDGDCSSNTSACTVQLTHVVFHSGASTALMLIGCKLCLYSAHFFPSYPLVTPTHPPRRQLFTQLYDYPKYGTPFKRGSKYSVLSVTMHCS
jgi:hypothetical protein